MFQILEVCKSFFLLSIGAILGCSIRMYLTSFFSPIVSAKHWATFLVNILATFFLGLFLSFHSNFGLNSIDNNSPLFILISIGFLGSLSTFSTFIIDLLNLFMAKRWKKLLSLSVCSLLGGFMAALAGLTFGNV